MQPLNNNKQTSLNTGMIKDLDPQLLKEGQYTHAINSQLNSHEGNYSFLQNEPGNKLCLTLPNKLKFIGAIALLKSRFAIFSTDNTNSEIGVFDSNSCTYTTVINDPCLGFNTKYLIKGVSKENTDCTESIYWANDFHPNRFLNLSKVPYKYTFADDTCQTKIYSTDLDCDQLLIDQIITVPCLSIKKSNAGGTILNGSYQAAMAYSINGQIVSDYYSVTTPQSLFTHDNIGGALDVEVENLDTDFEEFQLFIIATVAQQTTVYQIGTYSTRSKEITVSSLIESTTVPLSNVFLQKVVYTNSKDVVTVDNRLLWIGANTKEELNYQKAANDVVAKWVAYAVPADYYKNGGKLVGYMGNETYPFGIQWLYNTGDYSSVFPFIGREATAADRTKITNKDAYELFAKNCEPVAAVEKWQAYNTASGAISSLPASDCKEFVIGTGTMAYDESTELYPDNPELYGDLACTPIRHFRFPDECIVPKKINGNNDTMIILGIQFDNIKHPVGSDGKPLTNIVGYRIVRGDRSNNKRILGKGILFNMGEYDLPVSKSSTVKAMYPNAPFNDLRVDPYLSKKQVKGGTKEKGFEAMGTYSKTHFTFHSPSMSFDKPSLGTELNIGLEISGKTITNFEEPFGHPKHKILSDVAFIVASLLGIAEAYFATRKKECKTLVVKNFNPGSVGTVNGIGNPAIAVALSTYMEAVEAIELAHSPGAIEDSLKEVAKKTFMAAVDVALLTPGAGGEMSYSEEHCKEALDTLPAVLRALNDVYLFSFYFQQGFQTALDAINNFAKFEQYAYQVNSYCLYDNQTCPRIGNRRRYIDNASYLYPAVQQFEGIQVNNFKRESSVILKINEEIQNPTTKDTSRETLTTGKAWDTLSYEATASSYYGAIQQKLPGQYGQLNSIKWLSTGNCNPITTRLKTYSSGPIFGGDTYINRFTQKRKLQYFNQTEFQENNGHEFDYRKYYNLPYARYWMNTFKYDLSSLISLTDPQLPNDQHNFDRKKTPATSKLKSPFILRDQAFYLSNNSVIEYFVESEYNLDYRDWEEQPFLRHFDRDRYSNLSTLLRSDYLDYDNRYLYDKSLSKQLTEGYFQMQSPDFDPQIASTCYKTYSNRVYWSLPYYKGQVKDSWGFNLTNNNFNFPASNGKLTSAKALDRTNILFFFEDSGPWIHQAQDTLELDSGIKVTLGDSGLFGRPPVPLVNTDIKYGNCQSKFAFTNTQYGLFYPSLRQGRVFQVMGTQLKDISMEGLNWWFKANMPYKLTIDFPTFTLLDNAVNGIGYLSAFDNTDEIYYLSKKDYRVRPEYKSQIRFDLTTETFKFKKTGMTTEVVVSLLDSTYFVDAGWTVSYNPKTQSWVSFHDWHPNAILQEEKKFSSILTPLTTASTIWKHNERCDAYSNFYNIQYPWEIEYVINNGPVTSILQNVEYSLECFKYSTECVDKNHLLDYNFNEAILYNTEQISGVLKLNIASKNQISKVLNYPIINTNSIDIVFHKEEQKYRFNQFWDITNDRGEFSLNRPDVFITQPDGYHYIVNPTYVNYAKPPFERKKLRHNWHKVYLRRTNIQDDLQPKMIFKLANNKQIISPR